MAANTSPIYSAKGDIQGGDILTTGGATYTGQAVYDAVVFSADITNGGYVQRIRFKPVGINIATVARIYYNNGTSRFLGTAAATGQPTGTPSASGGGLLAGSYYAKIVTIDQYGGKSVASVESALVTVTGTGSIAWAWTAVAGAAAYRIYVGPTIGGGQITYWEVFTNSFLQTVAVGTRDSLSASISNNNSLIGEVSLPAVAALTPAAAAVDIDYPLNFALPPGGRIIVGLGTTVAAGWAVTVFGGEY